MKLRFSIFLTFLPYDNNICWTTDPVVQSLLCGAFKLVFDLLRGGHLQRVFNLAVRQSRFLGCLGTQTEKRHLLTSQIQPAGTSWHLCQRRGFSDVFVLAPDPSPQLPGQLLHPLVSSFLPFLHRCHKAHRRQGAWGRMGQTGATQTFNHDHCSRKTLHKNANGCSFSSPGLLIHT